MDNQSDAEIQATALPVLQRMIQNFPFFNDDQVSLSNAYDELMTLRRDVLRGSLELPQEIFDGMRQIRKAFTRGELNDLSTEYLILYDLLYKGHAPLTSKHYGELCKILEEFNSLLQSEPIDPDSNEEKLVNEITDLIGKIKKNDISFPLEPEFYPTIALATRDLIGLDRHPDMMSLYESLRAALNRGICPQLAYA